MQRFYKRLLHLIIFFIIITIIASLSFTIYSYLNILITPRTIILIIIINLIIFLNNFFALLHIDIEILSITLLQHFLSHSGTIHRIIIILVSKGCHISKRSHGTEPSLYGNFLVIFILKNSITSKTLTLPHRHIYIYLQSIPTVTIIIL